MLIIELTEKYRGASLSEMAYYSLGKYGKFFMDITLVTSQWSFSTAIFMFLLSSMNHLLESNNIDNVLYDSIS